MLAPALHPLRRYRPGVPLDFIPSCAKDLPAACGRQDGEFERTHGHALLIAKFGHEDADNVVWQRGEMLDTFYLGARWKQLIEMATPSCGIVSISKAMHFRPGQHRLDAPPNAARRLR